MGLGQYVFPRMAVHIASGRTVPVERLRAHCLWYPAVSLDGREVSGHVLYFSQALEDALGVVLGRRWPLPVSACKALRSKASTTFPHWTDLTWWPAPLVPSPATPRRTQW